MLSKNQFKRLRTKVQGMQGYTFTTLCLNISPILFDYVSRTFDGLSPLGWLYRRSIYATQGQYRDYCVRWLDSVEHLICNR
jgi:hypothetical protein